MKWCVLMVVALSVLRAVVSKTPEEVCLEQRDCVEQQCRLNKDCVADEEKNHIITLNFTEASFGADQIGSFLDIVANVTRNIVQEEVRRAETTTSMKPRPEPTTVDSNVKTTTEVFEVKTTSEDTEVKTTTEDTEVKTTTEDTEVKTTTEDSEVKTTTENTEVKTTTEDSEVKTTTENTEVKTTTEDSEVKTTTENTEVKTTTEDSEVKTTTEDTEVKTTTENTEVKTTTKDTEKNTETKVTETDKETHLYLLSVELDRVPSAVSSKQQLMTSGLDADTKAVDDATSETETSVSSPTGDDSDLETTRRNLDPRPATEESDPEPATPDSDSERVRLFILQDPDKGKATEMALLTAESSGTQLLAFRGKNVIRAGEWGADVQRNMIQRIEEGVRKRLQDEGIGDSATSKNSSNPYGFIAAGVCAFVIVSVSISLLAVKFHRRRNATAYMRENDLEAHEMFSSAEILDSEANKNQRYMRGLERQAYDISSSPYTQGTYRPGGDSRL